MSHAPIPSPKNQLDSRQKHRYAEDSNGKQYLVVAIVWINSGEKSLRIWPAPGKNEQPHTIQGKYQLYFPKAKRNIAKTLAAIDLKLVGKDIYRSPIDTNWVHYRSMRLDSAVETIQTDKGWKSKAVYVQPALKWRVVLTSQPVSTEADLFCAGGAHHKVYDKYFPNCRIDHEDALTKTAGDILGDDWDSE